MGLCGTLGLASKELLPGYYKKVFGSCGLQEQSSQSGKIARRFTQLQFDRIYCHRRLLKSILSRLLHLGVTMSRRSSGGGNDIAENEGQRYGPEVLFSRGGVSPSMLEHEETLTAALVAIFWSITTSTKKL